MKKNIYTIISIILVLTMLFAIPVSAAKKGDLDNDGIISAADARLALRMSVGLEELDMISDVDGDGKVSAADARLILRVSVGLENFEKETTTEPEETTTEPEETTTENKPIVSEELKWLGPDYSPERAGLVYNVAEQLSSYDEIFEGAIYFEYDKNGYLNFKKKPYSAENKPEYDYYTCQFCGNYCQPYNGKHYGCYYGFCSQWYIDINCPECGEFVPRNTCHSCKF